MICDSIMIISWDSNRQRIDRERVGHSSIGCPGRERKSLPLADRIMLFVIARIPGLSKRKDMYS